MQADFAFYIFGISDLQDLLPVILTSLKKKKRVWVCFMDSLLKKRQFYYYDQLELKNFIYEICQANDLSNPEIAFYGRDDKALFEKEYSSKQPRFVFLQNVIHKHIAWYPNAERSKIIHFAWHMDSARNIMDTHYNVVLNSLKFRKDLAYFGKLGINEIPDWVRVPNQKKEALLNVNSQYFGNLRSESLNFSGKNNYEISAADNQRTCFIIEAHLRNGDHKLNRSTVETTVKLMQLLKDKGFYVVWKKREKGFPKGDWHSPLDICDAKPDLIIEKDLNFPNTITALTRATDHTIVLNTSTAIFDACDVSNSVTLLHPEHCSERELRVYRNRYENQSSFFYVRNDWRKLEQILDKPVDKMELKHSNPSELLLDKIEEI